MQYLGLLGKFYVVLSLFFQKFLDKMKIDEQMLDERGFGDEAEELLSEEKRGKLNLKLKVTPKLIGTAVRTLATLSELVLTLDYIESIGEMFISIQCQFVHHCVCLPCKFQCTSCICFLFFSPSQKNI